MPINWADYAGLTPAGCLPCCAAEVPEEGCWLTVPTVYIDGTATAFPNSMVAQNFFDNSGAIIGCTSSFPGDPACDCLIESQTNHAADTGGSTTFESYNGTLLDFFSRPSTDVNGAASHKQLFKFYASANTTISINTVVSGGFDYYGVGSNVTIYYENFVEIDSNVVSNGNIDPNVLWSTYQNFAPVPVGYYLISAFSNVNPVANIAGNSFGIRYLVAGDPELNICPVRANYGSGFITCQSGM